MRSVDLSLSYADARKCLPPQRQIEDVAKPIARTKPPKTMVTPEPYLPAAELERVVDLAVALGRPLLVQGEPGCGKTQLAAAVAYALALPLEVAYVKSTSRAQDLLYVYDAVRRLYDSQLGAGGPKDASGKPLARAPENYITLTALGRAITRAAYGRRSVVLIDEIDKADLDFPNDLLWELDRMEFAVPEAPVLGAKADVRPIVIITHNEEKPLPPAFLRRCVYCWVEFPSTKEKLEEILAAHGVAPSALSSSAIATVERLRQLDLSKKPGLTELIDWVRHAQAIEAEPDDLARLRNSEVLLKDRGDQERARREIAKPEVAK
ncbi:MoxR-like ATPase [Bradyrhizobium japonicum]